MDRQPLGRSFAFLWSASAISNLADGVWIVAVPLLAAHLTRDPLLVALVSAASTAPWLLFTLFAGALADRRDRRRIMVAASLGRALVFALAATAAVFGDLSLAVLCTAALLVGIGEVFADTTAQSVLPMVVPRERLAAANGRLTSVQTLSNAFLGGPLAGVLVAATTIAAFAVPAVMYAASAVLLFGLTGRFVVQQSSRPATLRADIAEGLRYLFSRRLLRNLAYLAGALNFAGSAYLALWVLWVVGVGSPVGLEPSAYGLLTLGLAAGGITGSLLAEHLTNHLGDPAALVCGLLTLSCGMAAPVIAPNLWAVIPAVTLIGAGGAVSNVVIISMRQRLVPEVLFGRVNATYRLLAAGTSPLGALAGGAVASFVGLRYTLCGAVAACLAAIILTYRGIRAGAPEARESPGDRKEAEEEGKETVA